MIFSEEMRGLWSRHTSVVSVVLPYYFLWQNIYFFHILYNNLSCYFKQNSISYSYTARYYLIFVDHFTKYIWFYPMKTKSSVRTIFPQFKILVENRFQLKIKFVYLDNGGEFVVLKYYFTFNGINHYTTTPYTPQKNGVSERRHRHLVETGLTLLHDAFLVLQYWPHVFFIVVYLINRQPIPLLHHSYRLLM